MEEKSKVLILDDEANIVNLLTEILERNSHIESESCIDPLLAKEKVDANKYDLIITDFRMPNMNGGEFVKYIREESKLNKETAVLFVTANSEQTKEFVESYEEIIILEKPITIEVLAKKVINSIVHN